MNKWYDKYLKDYKPDKSKKQAMRIATPKVGGAVRDKKRYTRKKKHRGKADE